jgi:hypothetical protein
MSLTHWYLGGVLVDSFGANSNMTVIIKDTPLPTVQFQEDSYSVNEDAGTLTFYLTINRPVSDEVVVNYTTSDGTALADANYTTTIGMITFAAGSNTPMPITVPILYDGEYAGDTFFFVNLTGISPGIGIGSPDVVRITIVDPDAPAPSPTPTPVQITPTPVPVMSIPAQAPAATPSPTPAPAVTSTPAPTATPVPEGSGNLMAGTPTPVPLTEPVTSTENTDPGSWWSLLLVFIPIAGIIMYYFVFPRVK